jgi:hypothetical protein
MKWGAGSELRRMLGLFVPWARRNRKRNWAEWKSSPGGSGHSLPRFPEAIVERGRPALSIFYGLSALALS